MGVTIDGITQSPITEKQEKTFEYKTPETKKAIEKFLRFAGYYRKFVPRMATIAAPLYGLLRNKNNTKITWTEKENTAFLKKGYFK